MNRVYIFLLLLLTLLVIFAYVRLKVLLKPKAIVPVTTNIPNATIVGAFTGKGLVTTVTCGTVSQKVILSADPTGSDNTIVSFPYNGEVGVCRAPQCWTYSSENKLLLNDALSLPLKAVGSALMLGKSVTDGTQVDIARTSGNEVTVSVRPNSFVYLPPDTCAPTAAKISEGTPTLFTIT